MLETITMIIKLLGGVALFLFGMNVMGAALKNVAGNKLEALLYRLTDTPLKGIVLGASVTAVIQSSSATSVMVVGFVNSGMMKVAQAIGIIMGANIGTSITGWILCLSSIEGADGWASLLSTAVIAAIVGLIGIIFKTMIKKEVYHHVGDIMLGFAVLMVGMQNMTAAVKPLQTNEAFISTLTKFSNPALGILVGIIFTAVLQSASASVGIVQSLAMATGSLTFGATLPLVMGIGIGAACPVLLSAVGTSRNGKRTALIYLLNDLFGMIIWSILFYAANGIYAKACGTDGFWFMDLTMTPVTIALLNTVYRVLTILVLAPFIKQLEKLVCILVKEVPEEQEDYEDFDLLEEKFLAYPDLAIAQSHAAMNGMARKAQKNVYRAIALMDDYTDDKFAKIQEKENLLDKYEDKLGTYLMKLTGSPMNKNQITEASKLLHTISDFERIGDHASGISKVARELSGKGISFSAEAMYDLSVVEEADKEIVDITVSAFADDNLELAKQVEPLRQVVRMLCGELKTRHINRMQKGKCDMEHGFAFNDMINNLDRIAAHCSNVAVAMIELEAADFATHKYLQTVRELKDSTYQKYLADYEQKYVLQDYKKMKKKAKKKEKEV
ncbi:MAG: Na/Pi cotransporter family protein [Agathobacter sp.]|nr:Na/Pi cotransporter family protein [Agathobacter sp.]